MASLTERLRSAAKHLVRKIVKSGIARGTVQPGMAMTVKVMENTLSACLPCPIWGLLCKALP